LVHLSEYSCRDRPAPPRFYRKSEEKLATAQRANKTPKRIRNIHVKIANRRKDFLHKQSARIVKEYGLVVVGNVNPSRLAKTNMAKSVRDAGWAGFKHMLSYKETTHGGRCLEVNEAYVPGSVLSVVHSAAPKVSQILE
jgi:putative transposase